MHLERSQIDVTAVSAEGFREQLPSLQIVVLVYDDGSRHPLIPMTVEVEHDAD